MPTDVRSKRTPSSGSNIWTDPSRSKRRQIVKTIRNPNLAGAQGLSSAKSASTRTRFKELQKRTRRAFLWYDLRGDLSVLPWSLKLEQDLAAAIRFQRLPECFLELVERVHMLHCGGERSISYEVSELLVYFFDLCARRVVYPIDEPESVEAKTTVDELFGRHSWELPTLKAIHDNRAARFKRFGQLAHGRSTHRIEDEAKFLPVESLLNILV